MDFFPQQQQKKTRWLTRSLGKKVESQKATLTTHVTQKKQWKAQGWRKSSQLTYVSLGMLGHDCAIFSYGAEMLSKKQK